MCNRTAGKQEALADTYLLIAMIQYNNKTVSVITPVFNAAKYISCTLESILRQSYKDIEIILVDDCSTDNTREIIMRYIEKNLNIIYKRLDKNGGAAIARNSALRMAKGRYVAFLDSDDLWCEDKLEKQLAFMRVREAAMSCTAMDTMDEKGHILNSIREVKEIIDYNLLLRNTMIATSTVIIDRNKIGDFMMPLRRGGQDYATWLMLMRSGVVCHGLNSVLSHYRITPKSLSSNKLKSIKQVWQIQRQDEHLSRLTAATNVCFFVVNAFIKHFIK